MTSYSLNLESKGNELKINHEKNEIDLCYKNIKYCCNKLIELNYKSDLYENISQRIEKDIDIFVYDARKEELTDLILSVKELCKIATEIRIHLVFDSYEPGCRDMDINYLLESNKFASFKAEERQKIKKLLPSDFFERQERV